MWVIYYVLGDLEIVRFSMFSLKEYDFASLERLVHESLLHRTDKLGGTVCVVLVAAKYRRCSYRPPWHPEYHLQHSYFLAVFTAQPNIAPLHHALGIPISSSMTTGNFHVPPTLSSFSSITLGSHHHPSVSVGGGGGEVIHPPPRCESPCMYV